MLPRFIHQWSLRPGRLSAAALSLAILLALVPLASAAVTPDDPLVADVVRMLDAGIESDLVVSWLKTGDRRPAALSADALIALSEAKASRELIEFLLSMAPRTVPAAAATTPALTPEPVATKKDCCLVDFSVEYQVAEDTEGEEFELPGRDLYLYVDGQFLARLESQGNIASGGPVRFKAQLAPGAHALRFTRQLHTRSKYGASGDSWHHETTVSPSIIQFEVEPDALWQLDFSWAQSEFSTYGPLTWHWSRNGGEVAGETRAGEFREQWPFLCEDVEVSRDSGAISAWRARDRLKSCVSWSSLWLAGIVTDRAKVLAELGRFEFEPPVR